MITSPLVESTGTKVGELLVMTGTAAVTFIRITSVMTLPEAGVMVTISTTLSPACACRNAWALKVTVIGVPQE